MDSCICLYGLLYGDRLVRHCKYTTKTGFSFLKNTEKINSEFTIDFPAAGVAISQLHGYKACNREIVKSIHNSKFTIDFPA